MDPIFLNPNRRFEHIARVFTEIAERRVELSALPFPSFFSMPGLLSWFTGNNAGAYDLPAKADPTPRVQSEPWVEVPGKIEDNILTPWLEMTEGARNEMDLEERREKLKHQVIDLGDVTFVDLDGDGRFTRGKDAVMVAVDESRSDYDTETMAREGDQLLDNFFADEEYRTDPRWTAFDKNKDGVLDQKELIAYRATNPDKDGDGWSDHDWDHRDKRHKTFDPLDTNGDGKLSAAELKQGVGNSALGARRSIQAWVDHNRNGKVDTGELYDPSQVPDPELEGRTRDLTITRNEQAASVLHGERYDAIAEGDIEMWFDLDGDGRYDRVTKTGDYTSHRDGTEEGGRTYRMLTGQMTAQDYDYNGDGTVESWERELAENEAAYLRHKFDADGDGTITAKELAAQGGRIRVRTEQGWKDIPADLLDEQFDGKVRVSDIDVSGLPRSPELMVDLARIDADVEALRKAFEDGGFLGFGGTDEAALTRLLTGRSNLEINLLKARYQKKYGESLESRVHDETSGDYRKTLKGLLDGRDESGVVNQEQARRDAKSLYKAMKGWGTDEQTLIDILTSRSPEQLKAIMEAFGKPGGDDLIRWIKDDTSGDFKDALVQILEKARNA